MDKYEYNVKLEEINRLVNEENYKDAAKLADTVDWRRVRNARTLCMVSEIYEANGRLEDSKEILMRAYRRSQIGRVVLYRLTELAIKMRDFDEAVEYYSEFVNVAPNDNSRYVLKYKIYKGRGSSIEDQIAILEEYKEKEYTEKWAYELAKLYDKVGEKAKCIEECDDLVLWFRQGRYVIKALELKKKLVPLSSAQQALYAHRGEQIESADQVSELEKVILETMPVSQEEALTENIITETQKEIAQAVSQHAAEAEAERGSSDETWRYHSGPIEQVEEKGRQTKEFAPVNPEAVSAGGGLDVEDLQKELANSMREIVSGVTRKESDEGIIEPMNEQPAEETEAEEVSQEIPPVKLDIDDVLTAMAAAAQEEVAAAEEPAETAPSLDESPVEEEQKPEEMPITEPARAEAELKEEVQPEIPGAIEVTQEPREEVQAEPTEPPTPSPVQESETKEREEKVPESKKSQKDLKEEPVIDLSAVLELAAGIADMRPKDVAPTPVKEEIKREEIPSLTPDELYIFSYFSTIQGLREQIAQALCEAKKKVAMDRTSRTGNIVITGLPGCGRTTLGIRFAKVLSRARGEKAARIAKIYAEDFNKKDIPSTVAKIAGGTLIIEEAGDLEDAVITQLSKAMEFRTDGLLIILEDEKHLLKAVFDRHPEFAEKFSSEVDVPIFTNDELVAFGKTYAFDEDYKIDDQATVALYEKIGAMQTPEHPATVLDVKELVDKAICYSERFSLRKFGMILSKKRYDEDDRIILYEKDFAKIKK